MLKTFRHEEKKEIEHDEPASKTEDENVRVQLCFAILGCNVPFGFEVVGFAVNFRIMRKLPAPLQIRSVHNGIDRMLTRY